MVDDLKLEWGVSANSTGESMTLSYKISNTGTVAYYVADGALWYAWEREKFKSLSSDWLVVPVADSSGRLRLVRGYMEPNFARVAYESVPAVRLLAPGEILEGSATLLRPFQVTHPLEDSRPVEHPVNELVLEVGILSGNLTAHQKENGYQSGLFISTVAFYRCQQFLKGAVILVPEN